MDIRKAILEESKAAASLAAKLWTESEPEEREREMQQLIESDEAAIFLAFEAEKPVAFAQCQLRHDYVEGCETSPVGYLEGIYVEATHRGSGLAVRMLEACQQWSRKMGCREFASDCELENEASLRFHMKNGFEEAGRIICFVKQLG